MRLPNAAGGRTRWGARTVGRHAELAPHSPRVRNEPFRFATAFVQTTHSCHALYTTLPVVRTRWGERQQTPRQLAPHSTQDRLFPAKTHPPPSNNLAVPTTPSLAAWEASGATRAALVAPRYLLTSASKPAPANSPCGTRWGERR